MLLYCTSLNNAELTPVKSFLLQDFEKRRKLLQLELQVMTLEEEKQLKRIDWSLSNYRIP